MTSVDSGIVGIVLGTGFKTETQGRRCMNGQYSHDYSTLGMLNGLAINGIDHGTVCAKRVQIVDICS